MKAQDIAQLNESAEEASQLLKSLSSPIRLKILCQMVDGECSVGEIAANIGIRDTLASQHLSLLRREGIVATRREAQTIYYRVESAAAHRLLGVLHECYCGTTAAPAKRARKP